MYVYTVIDFSLLRKLLSNVQCQIFIITAFLFAFYKQLIKVIMFHCLVNFKIYFSIYEVMEVMYRVQNLVKCSLEQNNY